MNPLIVWIAEPASARDTLNTIAELDTAGVDAVILPGETDGAADALLLASAATRRAPRIGLVPALSPWSQPPFHTARALNTLDALSGGRAGWFVDDRPLDGGGSDDSGRWFAVGASDAERAEALADYLAATAALWNSWEPDSVIADVASGRYVDADRVHVPHYRGAYFASRGPLNAPRGPQGRPVRFASAAVDCADVVIVSSEDEVDAARFAGARVLLRLAAEAALAPPATAADGYAFAGIPRGPRYGEVLHGVIPALRAGAAARTGLLRERFGLSEEAFAFVLAPTIDDLTLEGSAR
ncbi:LLM class flavin-dependent oxidoreductase [Microbacteriaceae bacterium VKM Ac-2854]|nr:LLM class flavin-dependent oxidoreductase [Microbacteriaceae bacterium VKM Ac-2854]